MNKLLQALGLMRVSEQPVVPEADWEAKFKKAITDLEKQARDISHYKIALERMELDRDNWREQALRDEPDALAMRRKRERDRDRRKTVS